MMNKNSEDQIDETRLREELRAYKHAFREESQKLIQCSATCQEMLRAGERAARQADETIKQFESWIQGLKQHTSSLVRKAVAFDGIVKTKDDLIKEIQAWGGMGYKEPKCPGCEKKHEES